MKISKDLKNGILVLKLEGELMGGDEAPEFHETVYKAIRDEQIEIVVDMSAVKWMNSSGLGMLMAGLTTLRGSDGDLRLAAVPDRVKRPIEITRLDSVVQMYPTVDAAVESYGG